MNTYTITIETPADINPGTKEHWKQLLQNPANEFFIKSIERKDYQVKE